MRRFFGGLSVAVGILAGGSSGLCILLGVGTLADRPDPLAKNIAEGILIISVIVLAVSISLFFLGRHLLKTPPEE